MPLCWSPAKRAHKRPLSCLLTRQIKHPCSCHCEGSNLLFLVLTHISKKETLNSWENHNEFMFVYDQGACFGDDEIPLGKTHHLQVLAGVTFLSNVVMATDEMVSWPRCLPSARGPKNTGRALANHERRPRCPSRKMTTELEHVVIITWEGIQARQDAWVNSSPRDSGDDFANSI